jgi:hypothetical protein
LKLKLKDEEPVKRQGIFQKVLPGVEIAPSARYANGWEFSFNGKEPQTVKRAQRAMNLRVGRGVLQRGEPAQRTRSGIADQDFNSHSFREPCYY